MRDCVCQCASSLPNRTVKEELISDGGLGEGEEADRQCLGVMLGEMGCLGRL